MNAPQFDDPKLSDFPMHTRVQAIFNGTCAMRAVMHQSVVPVLSTMLNRDDREEALVGTYMRMAAWLDSLTRLVKAIDIQAVCSAARSNFELLLDLDELARDPTAFDRYHAFTFVERFRAAQLLVEHCKNDPAKAKTERQFVGNPANADRCGDLLDKVFGCKRNPKANEWPKHWSKRSVADRAKLAGPKHELIYRHDYPRLSWFIHAGAAGIAGVSEGGIAAGFAMGNGLSQDFAYDATQIVAKECHLFDGKPSLKDELEGVKGVIAKSLMDAHQEMYGQPSPS